MSTLTISNLNDGTTTVPTTFVTNGSAKAWATIDQENSPSSVQDSFNVSSINDDGGAKNTISFSSNMGNALYSFSFGVSNGGGFNDAPTLNVESTNLPNVNNFRFYCLMNSALNAARIASITFHGDLA